MRKIGSLLGILGAAEGAFATLVFNWAQSALLPSGQQFLMAISHQDNGFHFTIVLFMGFVLSGLLALLSSKSKWLSKFSAVIVMTLGIILTFLSILSALSIGMLTFYGAVLVLLSGILLIIASLPRPL